MTNYYVRLTKTKGFLTSETKLNEKLSVDPHKRIKQVIWLYFFLLIFEGALRKWILPQFSTPLLIIRDPVAIWLLILFFQRGLLKFNSYIVGMCAIAFVTFSTAISFGHGNLYVALYGLRTLILHFPVIFVIGRIFDYRDVVKMGKVLLWISIPMTLLMIVQFYSPQSDWVNRGLAGSTDGGGFSGALGFFRPPGTFSFISGLTQFYGLVGAFIFYFWLDDSKAIKKWVLFVTSVCLLMSIPFSISRTLFFEITISLIFGIVAASRTPKYIFRIITAFIVGIILLTILSNFDFFQTGVEAFTARFDSANEVEGGAQGIFFDRFLGGMIGALINSNNIPFWGYGLGMGTNVGAMILTGYSDIFLISEGEWGRLIGEMGVLLGIVAIIIRVSLAVKMTLKAIPAMINKNFLPWMLLSFSFLNIIQGQWAQPTSLGFAVLSGGLVLASLKKSKQNENFKPN